MDVPENKPRDATPHAPMAGLDINGQKKCNQRVVGQMNRPGEGKRFAALRPGG
jgi:hypothetical protein